jgi:hypothetical protein
MHSIVLTLVVAIAMSSANSMGVMANAVGIVVPHVVQL